MPESDKDAPNILPELQSCINEFGTKGPLTQEESRSISNALFHSPVGRNLVTSGSPRDMKSILQSSINSYLSQKRRRAEIGREAIGNPGSYIRSIVKKEIDLGKTNKAMSATRDNIQSPVPAVNLSLERQSVVGSKDAIGVSKLRGLLRYYSIESDELNEMCLHALSKHEESIVNDALKVYNEQKKRREENNMNIIANPSSYVMAIVR